MAQVQCFLIDFLSGWSVFESDVLKLPAIFLLLSICPFGLVIICIAYLSALVLGTAAAANSLQSCQTLCDPIDGSPWGSAIPGILQARTLEWVAISFSSAWKWKVKVKLLIRVRLFATPWTAAYQAPLSMGFSRQEYWGGLPLPSPSLGHYIHVNNFSLLMNWPF